MPDIKNKTNAHTQKKKRKEKKEADNECKYIR